MANKVFLIGNAGNEVEVKIFDNGKKLAQFNLATNEYYRNSEGEKQTITQWHNIKAWGKSADIAEKLVRKGDRIHVEGAIRYDSYDDKEGNKRYVTSIIAERIEALTPVKEEEKKKEPKTTKRKKTAKAEA